MSINWGSVQTNVVSTIVCSIVVGAFAIVWKGATTVDEKVNKAVVVLKDQGSYIEKALEALQKELVATRESEAAIIQRIDELGDRLDNIGREVDQGKPEPDFPPPPEPPSKLVPREIPEANFIQQSLPNMPMMKD